MYSRNLESFARVMAGKARIGADFDKVSDMKDTMDCDPPALRRLVFGQKLVNSWCIATQAEVQRCLRG